MCHDGTVYKLQGPFADHKHSKLHILCIIGDIYGSIESSSPPPCVVAPPLPYCPPFPFYMSHWIKCLQALIFPQSSFLFLVTSFSDVFSYDYFVMGLI